MNFFLENTSIFLLSLRFGTVRDIAKWNLNITENVRNKALEKDQ